ncbi:MAG TPA: carbon storage regulator [Pirellulales bacterium]|nr:carbon storage regulator [Pirellulales bacterium]
MLVITRKAGETVLLDTPIGRVRLTVKTIRGDQVRLGIEAPPTVDIYRPEHVAAGRAWQSRTHSADAAAAG